MNVNECKWIEMNWNELKWMKMNKNKSKWIKNQNKYNTLEWKIGYNRDIFYITNSYIKYSSFYWMIPIEINWNELKWMKWIKMNQNESKIKINIIP